MSGSKDGSSWEGSRLSPKSVLDLPYPDFMSWMAAIRVVRGAVMSEMFMRSRYDPTANTSNLLSSRLEKFFRDNRQTINSYENKVRLKDRLLSTLSPVFPNAKLFIVGSSANGFGWDQSDLDLCLVIAPEEVRSKGGDQPVLEQLTPFLRGCYFRLRASIGGGGYECRAAVGRVAQCQQVHVRRALCRFHRLLHNL
uniref:Poly(A) RNA polymerase gld 2 A n=1 Tax=Echinococcus granulosus TaxID=6210 RepID=A0A068WX66_ECHGR|nr:poly(A) RNA polymerase gld 2 A [Echinococcus granulosus]